MNLLIFIKLMINGTRVFLITVNEVTFFRPLKGAVVFILETLVVCAIDLLSKLSLKAETVHNCPT